MMNFKIKITFFLPNLEGGGAERSVVRLLRCLNKENLQVTLLLGKIKGPLIEDIPKEVLVKELNVSHIKYAFFKLIKYFRQERPNIFVSFLSHVNVISGLAKIFSRTKTKLIISERTTFSHTPEITKDTKNRLLAFFFLKPLVKFTYPLTDAIVCVSKGVAEDISRFLPSSKINKVRVIYNPIVSDELYNLADQPVEYFWFSNQKIPIILAVGRLTKAKDYPTLLRAFALICKQKKAHLVILGEGEERKNLENLVHKLNLSESVALLGFQKNPYKFMKRVSVFVLSSKREGFPNVLVEAMTCGVPVVSTNCQSGPNEIIKDGENGILVPIGDEKALAKAILKVLNSHSLRQKFSAEGKKRAQDFTVEKSVKEYEKLFQEVLKTKSSDYDKISYK